MNENSFDSHLFKALGRFKHVRNWPDLNVCLQKIFDVFQSDINISYISHKLLLSKRLSQCLSPALPSGIQTKAIEVYRCVFDRIGIQRLPKNLHFFAPSLLQFFQSAGTSQKQLLLRLFSDFFLPLLSYTPQFAPPVISSILAGYSDDIPDFFNDIG